MNAAWINGYNAVIEFFNTGTAAENLTGSSEWDAGAVCARQLFGIA